MAEEWGDNASGVALARLRKRHLPDPPQRQMLKQQRHNQSRPDARPRLNAKAVAARRPVAKNKTRQPDGVRVGRFVKRGVACENGYRVGGVTFVEGTSFFRWGNVSRLFKPGGAPEGVWAFGAHG